MVHFDFQRAVQTEPVNCDFPGARLHLIAPKRCLRKRRGLIQIVLKHLHRGFYKKIPIFISEVVIQPHFYSTWASVEKLREELAEKLDFSTIPLFFQ